MADINLLFRFFENTKHSVDKTLGVYIKSSITAQMLPVVGLCVKYDSHNWPFLLVTKYPEEIL